MPDPTPAQIRGLIARDRGCVLCGASHARCHAHHLLPRKSRARGPTDIDNLALLCADCHRRVHDLELTVYFDRSTATRRTRRATPDEIAPRRREDDKRRPAAERRKVSGTGREAERLW